MAINSKQQVYKLVRYGLVGLMNTAIAFIMMYLLASLGFHYVTYTAIAYISAMLFSFLLNMSFTFQVQGHLKKRLITFFSINLFNLLIVEIIEIFLIEYHQIPHVIAVISGMTWYVFFGFIMNQWLAFRENYKKRLNYA